MSTFANLLTVIQQLPGGTVVKITKQWCTSQGLILNTQLVDHGGKLLQMIRDNMDWITIQFQMVKVYIEIKVVII